MSHSCGNLPCLMGKSKISMVMFNSYVKLPEGKFWILKLSNDLDDDWGYPYDLGNLHVWLLQRMVWRALKVLLGPSCRPWREGGGYQIIIWAILALFGGHPWKEINIAHTEIHEKMLGEARWISINQNRTSEAWHDYVCIEHSHCWLPWQMLVNIGG